MLESYEIENIEQLRAIADMLRLRIFEVLQQRPMTVTQLGEELGEAPAKMHYHVRELEKVGLLRLVETREKGGILEKYYQPIAREISVEKSLLFAPPDEALAMVGALLNQMKDGFQGAFREALKQKDTKPRISLGYWRLYLNSEEQEQLLKQIDELVKPFEIKRGVPEELEIQVFLTMYPQLASSPDPTRGTLFSTHNTQIVGSISYGRKELEGLLAENKRLNVNIIGVCSIDENVDADLAEKAFEHFHIVGTLVASDPVRDVLNRKKLKAY
jgi:DNA-binding transcriptional ArsR family regulator